MCSMPFRFTEPILDLFEEVGRTARISEILRPTKFLTSQIKLKKCLSIPK